MEFRCMNNVKQSTDASYLQRDYLLLSFPYAWIPGGFIENSPSLSPSLFHFISHITSYSVINTPAQLWPALQASAS